ncbi:MAG: PhoH family protein [Pontiellaceae bacterium]
MSNAILHFEEINEARDIGELLAPLLSLFDIELGAEVILRNCTVQISATEESTQKIIQFIEDLRLAQKQSPIDPQTVFYCYQAMRNGEENTFQKLTEIRISVGPRKPDVFPRTFGQQRYVDMLQRSSVTFGIGPAGTGKTYLAMAKAVSALLNEEVSRIILTRPAIEAGEHLGFLPGDFKQKVAPYLRPLYDALHDMLPADLVEKNIERGTIEVAPLAYMRGRTLNHAFVILDEAQNTTRQQMLMFLTRLGYESKCVITGDPSQVDLPDSSPSGLIEAREILKNIPDLGICELTRLDIVRHPLVQCIIEAYQDHRKPKA